MHIQRIEMTFGHTGNISGPPSPPCNTKLTFDNLLWAWCAESHTDSQVSKRPGQYTI